jgi:hypothetical protein
MGHVFTARIMAMGICDRPISPAEAAISHPLIQKAVGSLDEDVSME